VSKRGILRRPCSRTVQLHANFPCFSFQPIRSTLPFAPPPPLCFRTRRPVRASSCRNRQQTPQTRSVRSRGRGFVSIFPHFPRAVWNRCLTLDRPAKRRQPSTRLIPGLACDEGFLEHFPFPLLVFPPPPLFSAKRHRSPSTKYVTVCDIPRVRMISFLSPSYHSKSIRRL